MGPKTAELVRVLEELITLLKSDDESLWAEWMEQAKAWIVASDDSGIEKVLQAYGGMGSFNDLVLGYHEKDGVLQQRKGMGEMNAQLESLRTRVWELAHEIKREQLR